MRIFDPHQFRFRFVTQSLGIITPVCRNRGKTGGEAWKGPMEMANPRLTLLRKVLKQMVCS